MCPRSTTCCLRPGNKPSLCAARPHIHTHPPRQTYKPKTAAASTDPQHRGPRPGRAGRRRDRRQINTNIARHISVSRRPLSTRPSEPGADKRSFAADSARVSPPSVSHRPPSPHGDSADRTISSDQVEFSWPVKPTPRIHPTKAQP